MNKFYWVLAFFLFGIVLIIPSGTSSAFQNGINSLFLPMISSSGTTPSALDGLIIDHTNTDINKVPANFVTTAINQFRLSYAHTSHGSQIVSGMSLWQSKDALYSFNTTGAVQPGVLSLADTTPGGDLGSSGWASQTRTYLRGSGSDRNLVMWSWCGQLAGYSDGQVQTYLNDMNQLEKDFPKVRFVYMTVHTGGGEDPIQNDAVRAYARANHKVLFDFADMEKYMPDGTFYAAPSDDCPWCSSYCSAHAAYCADLNKINDCAHTDKLLCKIKSQAFWWMMARLAGWDGK